MDSVNEEGGTKEKQIEVPVYKLTRDIILGRQDNVATFFL